MIFNQIQESYPKTPLCPNSHGAVPVWECAHCIDLYGTRLYNRAHLYKMPFPNEWTNKPAYVSGLPRNINTFFPK